MALAGLQAYNNQMQHFAWVGEVGKHISNTRDINAVLSTLCQTRDVQLGQTFMGALFGYTSGQRSFMRSTFFAALIALAPATAMAATCGGNFNSFKNGLISEAPKYRVSKETAKRFLAGVRQDACALTTPKGCSNAPSWISPADLSQTTGSPAASATARNTPASLTASRRAKA